MSREHTMPADIERTSMSIIASELEQRHIVLPEEHLAVVKRVIHTTADFDYAENLHFTPEAVAKGVEAVKNRKIIITDTNMARSGVSKPILTKLGGEVRCYMAEPEIAALAREKQTTRAAVSMEEALRAHPDAILAVGNAPTALLTIADLMERGARPSLVIGVPVGFVNVVESKERIFEVCSRCNVPAIVAMGRKGGSTVAAAICNALLYTAADTLDPAARGWQ